MNITVSKDQKRLERICGSEPTLHEKRVAPNLNVVFYEACLRKYVVYGGDTCMCHVCGKCEESIQTVECVQHRFTNTKLSNIYDVCVLEIFKHKITLVWFEIKEY